MMISEYINSLKTVILKSAMNISPEPESILDLLYDSYFECHGCSADLIKDRFHDLLIMLDGLEPQQQSDVVDLVALLCMEHERAGFIEGIKIGVRLEGELAE